MSLSRIDGFRIAGVATCAPPRVVDNLEYGKDFGADEVRKVVSMAGVQQRAIVEPGVTSADLCFEAADSLLRRLGWARDSVTGLILVTQTPMNFSAVIQLSGPQVAWNSRTDARLLSMWGSDAPATLTVCISQQPC